MIEYYVSENGRLAQIDQPKSGCWVSVVSPTAQEVKELIEDFGLDSGFVKSSLDVRSPPVSSVRTIRH